jgi:uncharacterized coiled-coil protein SlyX
MKLDKGINMKVSNTLKSAITESLQNKLNVKLEDTNNALNAMRDELRPLIAKLKEKCDKAVKDAITSEIQALLSANPNVVLTKSIDDIIRDNVAYRLYAEDGSISYVGKRELDAEIEEQHDKLKAAVSNIIITLELGSKKDTVKDLIDAVTFD